MGYMTTVTFLNDLWHEIEKHPKDFISSISDGMNGYDKFHDRHVINDFGIGCGCNSVKVARSHHADEDRLYLVGGNTMFTFGYANDDMPIELRKRNLKIAKQLLKIEEERIIELDQTKL